MLWIRACETASQRCSVIFMNSSEPRSLHPRRGGDAAAKHAKRLTDARRRSQGEDITSSEPLPSAPCEQTALERKLAQTPMKRVTEIFKAWDMNGDGRISCKEFSRALTALGVRATPEDIDAFFKSLDRDHSGSIEFAELRALLHSLQRLERARPSHANLTDSDKLGQLAAAAGSGGHLSRWAQPAAKILLGTLLTDEIKPIDELRCEILGKGTAVIELFRSWDLDKDGKVAGGQLFSAFRVLVHSNPPMAAGFSTRVPRGCGDDEVLVRHSRCRWALRDARPGPLWQDRLR